MAEASATSRDQLSSSPVEPLAPYQREWLARHYQDHFGAVERACRRVLKDPDDAADAANDVFIKAASAVAPDLPEAGARPWLLTIARNHCVDVLRRRKIDARALALIGQAGGPDTNPEAAAIDRQTVIQLLSSLPARERTALWQNIAEQRPVTEVASSLKLNYMAAAQVLSRARRHALSMAAKVAAIIFGIRWWKAFRAWPASVAATRAIALLLIPAAVIATQAGSNSRTDHLSGFPNGGRPAAHSSAAMASHGIRQSKGASSTQGSAASPAAVPSSLSSVSGTLSQQVGHVLAPLPNPNSVTQTVGGIVPSVKITPLPTASSPVPLPTPSVSLPLPTPSLPVP